MLTKKELALKVFHNEEAERIPVLFTHHYLNPYEFNEGIKKPELLQKNLDGAREFKELFSPDIVKIMTDGFFFLPYDYSGIRSAADLAKIRPLEGDNIWFEKNIELVKGYREIYGDDILIFFNVFAPLTQLRNGIGEQLAAGSISREPVLELLTEDAAAVAQALDVIAGDIEKLIGKVIGLGLSDGIYLSVSNPNRRIPADIYSAFIAPSEKRILAAAKALAPDHILHICGYEGNKNILSVYKDYDVNVINWAVHAEQFGLKDGREFFGGKAVIGGFDNTKNSVLYKGSIEEIDDYIEKLIGDVGKRGVIIGADCTVPADIDVERLKHVREKAAQL